MNVSNLNITASNVDLHGGNGLEGMPFNNLGIDGENLGELAEEVLGVAGANIGELAEEVLGEDGENIGELAEGSTEEGSELGELEAEKKSLTSQQSGLTRKIKTLDAEEKKLASEVINGPFEDGEGEDTPESVEKRYRYNQIREEKAGLISEREGVISRKNDVNEQIAAIKETSSANVGVQEPIRESTATSAPQLNQGASSQLGRTDINSRVGKELQNGAISIGSISINADSVNMQGAGNIKFAGEGQIKTEAEIVEQKNTGLENSTSGTENNLLDDIEIEAGPMTFKDKLEMFNNVGGIGKLASAGNEAYKGLHSIADTLYVDGQAPTDWKGTAGRTDAWIKEHDAKTKERVDREKDSWAHNKMNISVMTDKYMSDPKFREQYSDKPEPYIRRKAEEKAKSALKDMSAYVPYGVTDVHQAYELYDSANKNAYTPEQAIRSKAGYDKFNNHVENVAQINVSGNFKRNDYKSVEEAIPNANVYYNAGYRDINQMMDVAKIADLLGKTPEFAIQVDQVLKRNGGKIKYNGTDKAMADVIKQINAHYGG